MVADVSHRAFSDYNRFGVGDVRRILYRIQSRIPRIVCAVRLNLREVFKTETAASAESIGAEPEIECAALAVNVVFSRLRKGFQGV